MADKIDRQDVYAGGMTSTQIRILTGWKVQIMLQALCLNRLPTTLENKEKQTHAPINKHKKQCVLGHRFGNVDMMLN